MHVWDPKDPADNNGKWKNEKGDSILDPKASSIIQAILLSESEGRLLLARLTLLLMALQLGQQNS